MVSKAKRRWRLAKTLILAVVAVGALAWSAVASWDVDPQELLQFFLFCLLLLLLTAGLGVAGAAILTWLRKRR